MPAIFNHLIGAKYADLVDCSVGLRRAAPVLGGCFFYYSAPAPSFQFTHFLPPRSQSPPPPIPLFLTLLPPSHPLLECRRRRAAGRLRRCLGRGGRPPRPGPRWVPGAATTPRTALGPGGCHHAQDRAGSRGLPPQRPARALPRPGPHAPISEEPLGGAGG